METDRNLAVFAGQFVPLKIETKGQVWGKWASTYRPEGQGIPIIYVIRADGEMLYGKSGSLQGNDLLNLLAASLQKSGRSFDGKQLSTLTTLVAQMKTGLENKELPTAFQALRPLSKLGEPGNLQSYSTLALEADQLAQQVMTQAETALAESQEKLKDDSTAFEGVVELMSAKLQLAAIPKLKQLTDIAIRTVSKDPTLKDYIRPAEKLARGEAFANLKTPAADKQAATAYSAVIKTHAGTPAEKIARERLAKLVTAE
ncbi:MAG: hypothetical protein ACI9G1_005868, partial [Pirellulaceae bacterium]